MDQDTTDQDTTAHAAAEAAGEAIRHTTAASEAPEADELLIEEISIDGMCGVY